MRVSSGEAKSEFGFTSQREEAGFGLMDYNARYYSPVLGRFVSPDSIVPEPSTAGGFNRYRYARNSPLMFTDPTGHAECKDAEARKCNPSNLPQTIRVYRKNRTRLQSDEFALPFAEGSLGIGRGLENGHNARDYPGRAEIFAPGDGILVSANPSTNEAGLWHIYNTETQEERIYTNGVLNGGNRNALRIGDTYPIDPNDPNSPILVEPEHLLARDENGNPTGVWIDVEPSWSHEQGTFIKIDHGNGLYSEMIHIDRASVTDLGSLVGQSIEAGTPMGQTVNNGWSTGTHLHLSIYTEYRGERLYIDPMIMGH